MAASGKFDPSLEGECISTHPIRWARGDRSKKLVFLAKCAEIEGYILSDITLFPVVPVYVLSVENVIRWYKLGRLGTSAKVSRSKFLNDLLPDIRH